MTTKFLGLLGIDSARVKLAWISSAEGNKFARVANEFTQEIKNLGPADIRQKA
jgi:F420-non-reducing hydrogenase iron-sulfur subunit